MDKRIEILRKFFTISVATFEMQHTISSAFGYKGHRSYMYYLHINAKNEIEKESPDLNKIDTLLTMMEDCANENRDEQPAKNNSMKVNI